MYHFCINHRRGGDRRLLSGFLSLVMLLTLLPAISPQAQAAQENSWQQPYLEKLVSWGIMRGDQNGDLNPDLDITRAEFATIINRAYGYSIPGDNPFKDVSPDDWFYDDVRIAYRMGYFAGTSDSEAAPTQPLTREQATVILGRNLMLQEGLGESLDFTDSRTISSWSRGSVKSAAELGVVTGYPDGTFRPQQNISRGEAAVLLSSALGVPIMEPGDYSLGQVYGNVTISTSGVTLSNTVVAGDLYVTGGVGLGYVNLDNVTVLGKIVASGSGEGNKGDSSIILRNVTAPEMVVDSIANQFVTIRSEGDTKIDTTSVRTPSYLEDVTDSKYGFAKINLEGEDGTALELAGNMKEVNILTPNASVKVTKGTTQVLSVDETAPGTTIDISSGAEVKTLNLDVGARVTGKGDIETLNVYAAGTTTTMLPDKIIIRPGITANIAGEVMDSVTAAESSEDPRLLSGYPKAADLAPTSATVVFRTNKRGTIYWAVSSITDGSVGETDLINPPTYATKIIKSGTQNAAASGTDYATKITGLTSDGSYYLSAVLVDARGQRSPVKVMAFSTPDNTVPNFASGYPVMSKVTNVGAQVAVMATKSCQLYYALLPKGSAAPSAADFKSSAVTGNLGFGKMDLAKNTTSVFSVNDRNLEELTTYDLYLWLSDADGAQSSAVKKLSFTTVDGTPPIFLTEPTVNSIQATSVGLTATLNEAGTIFWVAVKTGEEYPKPLAGQTQKPALTSDTAKLQVASGMNAFKSGKVTATANKDAAISVSGLTSQTAYDLYYVAQDKAGNYSDSVKMITIHTLDTEPPVVTQEFTQTSDTAGKVPRADTDINIVFSESIQDVSGDVLLDLYTLSIDTSKPLNEREAARDKLMNLLRQDIQLWDATNVPSVQVSERTDDAQTDWTIDYRYATVKMDDGKTIITLKNGESLNLKSGSTYYFQIANIADTSNNKNILRPNPQKLESFKTSFAQVNLKATSQVTALGKDLHLSYQLLPVSTGKVDSSIYWDMLIWSDSLIKFNLYGRTAQPGREFGEWELLVQDASIPATSGTYMGVSLTKALADGGKVVYQSLNTLKEDAVYEYGIQVLSLNGETDSTAWSQEVKVQVSLAAGGWNELDNLANDVSPEQWTSALTDHGVTSIGLPDPFTMTKKFSDSKAPSFIGGYPNLTPTDSKTTMSVMLDRPGTIYYAVAPVQYSESSGEIKYTLTTEMVDEDGVRMNVLPEHVPKGGNDHVECPNLSLPLYTTIVKPNFTTNQIKSGSKSYSGTGLLDIEVSGLNPETMYYVYFVLKGTSSSSPFSQVLCYQFTTNEVTRPVIKLDLNNPSVNVTVSSDTLLDYILVVNGRETAKFKDKLTKYLANILDKDTVDEKYPNFTVLDAMSQDVVENGVTVGSVFDVYASQEAKDSFAGLIRNQALSESVVVKKGQETFLASKPLTPVDCKGSMTGSTTYTFLSVGHSSIGSGDAFRAIRPVALVDNEAPVVNKCSTTTSADITKPNGSFTGTLTVIFNEDLYYKTQSGYDQVIQPIEATTGLNPSSSFKPVSQAITAMDTHIKVKEGNKGEKISTLTFSVTSATPGALISFSGNLCDEGGNSRSNNPLILILKYEAVTDAEGITTYRPYFEITAAWDNTETRK